ncbi:hypothetical protein Hypma_013690 [Hypsizygus marmoreus]|uniref:Uncharacterized protein n=1 Tax=Hypsizygus marmoreus TaxID=39966 RepID=A0A369JKZ8_HYPMA|nr:hypothetical protein Hypma_013690 [Hypsizygus marmoreus]
MKFVFILALALVGQATSTLGSGTGDLSEEVGSSTTYKAHGNTEESPPREDPMSPALRIQQPDNIDLLNPPTLAVFQAPSAAQNALPLPLRNKHRSYPGLSTSPHHSKPDSWSRRRRKPHRLHHMIHRHP